MVDPTKYTNPVAPANLYGGSGNNLGVEATLQYRVELSEALANRFDANHVLLFDDTANGVPEGMRSQLHGLPGYERAILPGLMLAPGFADGATVLVSAPPNPVERTYVQKLKAEMEARLERPIDFRVAYVQDEKVVDLLSINDRDYAAMCYRYVDEQPTRTGRRKAAPNFLVETAGEKAGALCRGDRTLIMPFQTTATHSHEFRNLIAVGRVVLPDEPNLDKVRNNLMLAEAGEETMRTIPVAGDGGRIPNLAAYDAVHTAAAVPKTRKNALRYAEGIIRAVDEMQALQLPAMVKLDSQGVSGLSNVSPSLHPVVYDTAGNRNARVGYVAKLIEAMDGKSIPQSGIVEEFVDMARFEGVGMDYTVGGMTINGKFHLTSIVPFGTTNGVYDCLWIAPRPEMLGEHSNSWAPLVESFEHQAEIAAAHGYSDGIMAGDVFRHTDGRILPHDWNHRRGGREFAQALVALRPEGWFEAQVEVDLGELGINLSRRELFDTYTSVCRQLYEGGAYPFSTAFGYFGNDTGGTFMKLKVMVPTNKFRRQDGSHVPRSEHLGIVKSLVTAMALRATGKEIQEVSGVDIFTPDGVWPPYITGKAIANEIMPHYADNIQGNVVVDVGTGSGLLGMKAAQLRAAKVVALDLNPTAVTAVRINAALNNHSNVEVHVSDALQGLPAEHRGRVGLIVANPPTQPFLLSKTTSDAALRDGNARAWNEADGNGRGVLDRILLQGVEVLRPGGKIVTSTTTRHGHGRTTGMLEAMKAAGRISGWREVRREVHQLADMYREYLPVWQGLQDADGDMRVFQSPDGGWYHEFIVLEVTK